MKKLDKNCVLVYPNPIKDELKLNLGKTASYFSWQIVDICGIVLKDGMISENSNIETINVQDLTSGIYVIKLNGESGILSKTIIKE